MPKSSDSAGRNNSRPFLAGLLFMKPGGFHWLVPGQEARGIIRESEGVTGSQMEPQGATGGYREPGGTTGDHRALEAIRGHVSKNNLGGLKWQNVYHLGPK